MSAFFRPVNNVRLILALGAAFFINQGWAAEDHVATASDFHKEIRSAAQARQHNLAQVEEFFSTETVSKALRRAKLDPVKVEKALPLLDDEELSRLAAKAEKAQSDLSAGSLSNQDLTYIVIALAAAVFVLIIVAAH